MHFSLDLKIFTEKAIHVRPMMSLPMIILALAHLIKLQVKREVISGIVLQGEQTNYGNFVKNITKILFVNFALPQSCIRHYIPKQGVFQRKTSVLNERNQSRVVKKMFKKKITHT